MTTFQPTPLEDISRIHDGLFAAFAEGKSRDVAFRKTQLLQVAYMFTDNRQRMHDALTVDLNRPPNETEFLEFNTIINAALSAHDNVEKWSKPTGAPFDLLSFAMRPRTLRIPKGVVVVIGPFNYPWFSVFNPLIGAIAAGNAALIKPSEMAAATAALMAELVPKYLDPSLYQVVNGSIPETTAILDLQWDHIFFTGSTRVGRIVAMAAAKHITPVTLELGGKNPAIIDKDCDFDASARRILWSKTTNAGQSCTAVDYIMVVREAHDRLLAALEKAFKQFFPSGAPNANEMSHVINAQAFQRITGDLARTKGTIVLGGQTDAACNFIAPTVVDNCMLDDALMEQEIFGPILPIITVESVEAAIETIRRRNEHPLGCYIFSKKQKVIDYVFANTVSGTVVANEALIQAGISAVPFGGIGNSGYGYSSGKFAFETFTHFRGSLQLPAWLEKAMSFRYPPYNKSKLTKTRLMEHSITYPRPGTEKSRPWGRILASLAVVVGLAAVYKSRRT